MSAYTFRLGDLPKLDLTVDRGTDFAAWRTQWESSGLAQEDAAKQVKALTLCLSRDTFGIVYNLALSEAQMKKTSTIIDACRKT